MVRTNGERRAHVLLVEDNENDVLLTREGFKDAKLLVNLHHVENGRECMAFLRNEGQYADVPRPDLILLDLNMPVMDGREVLAEISADEQLRMIPTVVLTTSESEIDVVNMYRLHCSSYIVKPVDFEQFVRVIQGINEYWLTLVVLPPDTDY